MDSLIVLAKFCPSLFTMLKMSSEVVWPVVEWWPYMGEGDFRCSLNQGIHIYKDEQSHLEQKDR